MWAYSHDPHSWNETKWGELFIARRSQVDAKLKVDARVRDDELLAPWAIPLAIESMVLDLKNMSAQGNA